MPKFSDFASKSAAEEDIHLVGRDVSDGANVSVNPKLWIKPNFNKLINPKNINNIAVKHMKGKPDTNGTSTSTFNILTTAPVGKFTKVRLVFRGFEASSYTLDGGVIAAVTANNTNKVEPTVGNTITNDPTTGWCQMKVAGSTSIVVPQRISSTMPDYLTTDWLDMPSINPDNGNAFPYIIFRCRISSGSFTQTLLGSDATDDDKLDYHEIRFGHVNGVTDPTQMTESSGTFGTTSTSHFAYIEFMTDHNVIKVMDIGDSVIAGQGGLHDGYTYGAMVEAVENLIAKGYPINLIHHGNPSISSDVYAPQSKQDITRIKPQLVLFSLFSTNDGTITDEIAEAQYNRAIDMAAHVADNGGLYGHYFHSPNNTYTQAQDDIRKALIARCKADNLLTLDATKKTGDGGSPEKIKVGQNTDNIHLNSTGYSAASEEGEEVVEDILQRNFSYAA